MASSFRGHRHTYKHSYRVGLRGAMGTDLKVLSHSTNQPTNQLPSLNRCTITQTRGEAQWAQSCWLSIFSSSEALWHHSLQSPTRPRTCAQTRSKQPDTDTFLPCDFLRASFGLLFIQDVKNREKAVRFHIFFREKEQSFYVFSPHCIGSKSEVVFF